MKNVAVIGAGITGITLANLLQKKVNLTVFEKSRGVGGRMATRRAEPYQFNHGAQYFKIENKEFKNFLQPLIQNKIIKHLEANHIEILNKEVIKRTKTYNKIYYTPVSKMNSVVKYLINNNFFIKLLCKIDKTIKENDKWFIIDSDKASYGPYDWLFITIPPNQALKILYNNFKFLDIIKKIKMRSCYSLMLGFDKIKEFDFDTALFLDEDVQWLSIRKKIIENKKYYNLLINSSYNFAEKNVNGNKDKISDYLIKQVSDIIKYELNNYEHKALHFWKYAMSEKNNNLGSFLDEDLKVIVCGDWCMNGKVEGGFLSAKDAAKKLIKYI
ncbi:NAD(P)-binding protein [Alphaproteobacteria bacterium]|nr:NAD(P)-binding protein [Alphaproteobacteria bacterium]